MGRTAEDLAAAEAARLRMVILDRNWRTRWGELDLVGLDGDQLVVVEVKCRSTPLQELGPALALTGAKQRRLARLAGLYLQRRAADHGLSPTRLAVRFDVCLVVWATDKQEVTWLKDAFRLRR
ncbi:MAG: YraN family protein [Limnochordales bacterium]|nr:YraN family protein [Limnochordales bacterium]